MIPIQLKIKGLYSYVDEQQINFTQLINAGLFGIFGQVGSGKSSILEAIAFSVYARTERFNVSGDNRYYNMLNLKVNEATIEFSFKAGKKNLEYLSKVRISRNKNKFEDVSLHSHSYYQNCAGTLQPVTQAEVLEQIGISYENFKRTIIIPQGQFKEFLDLGPMERTKMLKDLFGLHRFDLSAKVSSLETANKDKINLLEGELISYEGINKEVILEFQNQLSVIKTAFEALESTTTLLETTVKTLETLKNNFFALQSKKEAFLVKQKQELADKIQEEQLKEFEDLCQEFKQLYKELESVQASVLTTSQEQQLRIDSKKEKELFLEKLESQLQVLEEENKQGEGLRRKVSQLDKLIEMVTAQGVLNEISAKVVTIKQKMTDFNAEVEEKRNLKREKEKANIALEAKIIPEAHLYKIKTWFDQIAVLNLDYQKQKLELDKGKLALSNTEIGMDLQRNGAFSILFLALEKDFTTMEFETIFNLEKRKITLQIESARSSETKLSVIRELYHYAAQLQEGKACMLCGAEHHPNPINRDHSEDDFKKVQLEIQRMEKQQDALMTLRIAVLQLLTEKGLAIQKIAEQNTKITELRATKETLVDAAPDNKLDQKSQEVFMLLEKESNTAKTEFEGNIKQGNAISLFIDSKLEAIHICNSALTAALVQESEIVSFIKTKREDLTEISVSNYAQNTAAEIEAEKTRILADVLKKEQEYSDAKENKIKIGLQIASLKGQLESIAASLMGFIAKETALKWDISHRISLRDREEKAILAIISQELNPLQIRHRIAENRAEWHVLSGEIKTFEEQVGGHLFDQEVYDEKVKSLHEARQKRSLALEKKGSLEGQLITLQASIIKKTALQTQLALLQIRATDINTLRKLFIANGFVEFVSKRYLQNVVAVANVRFQKMVRQKYKLELSEKGDFLVRDYLNGGKTRLLKSLSGGQTFQAALCLALALSESIQHNAGIEQHFFFLDEGFGSLDKDSLQIVFETLKSLQKDNRVVGLISHVEELQQEMDVFLKIENDSVKGTIITESWN